MLPPAPSVVVGATVIKRFPGYGVHRGTIAELDIDGGTVLVHWSTTDERTTLSLTEAAKRVVASPLADEEDDDQSVTSAALGIESSATSFSEAVVPDDAGGARAASSRFWGVHWNRSGKKWQAYYKDADGKLRHIGLFNDDEEAARAVNKAIRDAGLEGRRKTNAVDATGALVPRERTMRDRAAIVAPDPSRAPTETTSKFWGVSWDKKARRWQAKYRDANGKLRSIGNYDTQEQAAHAVNAAIRRAGLEGKRRTNPVVDGRLVPPKKNPASGHGRRHKRRRDEPAATPSPRARRPRRAVNYDSEPDDGNDEDLELGPPDDDGGWD